MAQPLQRFYLSLKRSCELNEDVSNEGEVSTPLAISHTQQAGFVDQGYRDAGASRAGQHRAAGWRCDRFRPGGLSDLREEIAHCERRGPMHDACMVCYIDLVQ